MIVTGLSGFLAVMFLGIVTGVPIGIVIGIIIAVKEEQ